MYLTDYATSAGIAITLVYTALIRLTVVAKLNVSIAYSAIVSMAVTCLYVYGGHLMAWIGTASVVMPLAIAKLQTATQAVYQRSH